MPAKDAFRRDGNRELPASAIGWRSALGTEAAPDAERRRPIETPFGTIYSTNITPDAEPESVPGPIRPSSVPCARCSSRRPAALSGVSLHPFRKTTDADMQALYAYLMSQAPVRADTPKNTLYFPFTFVR